MLKWMAQSNVAMLVEFKEDTRRSYLAANKRVEDDDRACRRRRVGENCGDIINPEIWNLGRSGLRGRGDRKKTSEKADKNSHFPSPKTARSEYIAKQSIMQT
ncbi:hypothetical protein AB7M35_003559 [Amorphus suaedae]